MRTQGSDRLVNLSWSRLALACGPAVFALWFLAGQILFFAQGGESRPGQTEYASVALSNASSIRLATTLLVVAAALLIVFAGGLISSHRAGVGFLRFVIVAGSTGIAILLVLQAGLASASVELAREAPREAWFLFRLSSAIGFESYPVALLGATILAAVAVTLRNGSIAAWLWWTTSVVAVILFAGGILEGLDLVPSGRFSFLFALWIAIAGLSLAIRDERVAELQGSDEPPADRPT